MWKVSFMRNEDRSIKAIVGWSGGVDSTYLLWHLIHTTNYKIQAHHTHLHQGEAINWEAERAACSKIKNYLLNNLPPHRDIESISWSWTNYKSLRTTFDQDILLFILAQQALVSFDDCFVAYGVTKNDVDRWTESKGYYPWVGKEIFKTAVQNGDFVWGKDYKSHIIDTEVQFMLQDKYKADIIKAMPRDLVDLTWSCRKPIVIGDGIFKECGTCRACVERKEALND